jgi:hypothetical protein
MQGDNIRHAHDLLKKARSGLELCCHESGSEKMALILMKVSFIFIVPRTDKPWQKEQQGLHNVWRVHLNRTFCNNQLDNENTPHVATNCKLLTPIYCSNHVK